MANEDTVYKAQSALKIRLETNIDLTDATIMKIKYRKPSSEEGAWNASKDGTKIYRDMVDSDDIDESGTWVFWAHVTFAGGREAPGNPFQKHIKLEGH